MAGKPNKSLTQRIVRIGEGHAVDVSVIPAAKGGQAHYSLDTFALPVPERRLSCDAVGVKKAEYVLKLLFAQEEVSGDGLLSMLVVQMTFGSVLQFLATLNPLRDQIEKLEKANFPAGAVSENMGKAEQTAFVTASMILAGYSGTDGCLDFFYTSPFSLRSINLGNKISVEPVVRVNLPTPLLIAMWRKLDEIAPELRASQNWENRNGDNDDA